MGKWIDAAFDWCQATTLRYYVSATLIGVAAGYFGSMTV